MVECLNFVDDHPPTDQITAIPMFYFLNLFLLTKQVVYYQ